jgi:hypothetical protein
MRASSDEKQTPTAVVNEAYAKLAQGGKIPDVTEVSFKRIAAPRQALVVELVYFGGLTLPEAALKTPLAYARGSVGSVSY